MKRTQLSETELGKLIKKTLNESQLLLEKQYCGPLVCTDQQACAYNSTCGSCGASHHGSTGHKCVDMHSLAGTDGKDTRTPIRRSDSDRLRRKPNSPQARFRGGLGNSLMEEKQAVVRQSDLMHAIEQWCEGKGFTDEDQSWATPTYGDDIQDLMVTIEGYCGSSAAGWAEYTRKVQQSGIQQ